MHNKLHILLLEGPFPASKPMLGLQPDQIESALTDDVGYRVSMVIHLGCPVQERSKVSISR
eukprot:1678412-Amphidinium_carterae.1